MIKSLITKGILNDGEININRNYELPFNIEMDLSETEINLEIEKEINVNLEII
jgi:hypothetical protein